MTKLIEPYNPNWKTAFQHIKQVIETALGEVTPQADIQHIGSTSIEGLCAKPIIDIDIIIHNKALLATIAARLQTLGYINKGEQGIAGRFAFRQTTGFVPVTAFKDNWQPHHLYVCYADSVALKNHLLFRDTLRNDKVLVEKYAALKKSLTGDLKTTREAYNTQKTDFIISVLARAGLSEMELQQIINANTQATGTQH